MESRRTAKSAKNGYAQRNPTFRIGDFSEMIIPLDAWVPCTPAVISTPIDREPELYLAIIRQFPVETHVRWRKNHAGRGETYCNIYVWDCTRALSCEIPHWVDRHGAGNPTRVGEGVELNANDTCAWLMQHGPRFGWTHVEEPIARAHVATGSPAVVGWYNPNGIGHIAMLLPNGNIAQAGRTNFFDLPVRAGFGERPVKYFIHE